MKILSWNVNGIRAISKKGFWDWLYQKDMLLEVEGLCDILCVQETKCHKEQLGQEFLEPKGYHTFWSQAERKGYSGVAVFSKEKPLYVERSLGNDEFDKEGRLLQLEYKDFILFNVYFPNGGAQNKRVPFKMAFYDAFLDKVVKLKNAGKKIIICGDVNTAHQEIDLTHPKNNQRNTGFLPEERAWITKFLDKGFIDTFRYFNKEPGNYTWWDYKTRARSRNVGWRIDYFFISNNLCNHLKSAFILYDVMGSDHCPLGIEVEV